MPVLSRTGRAAMGVGDGVPSVDGVPVPDVVGGGTCWLDNDRVLYQCKVERAYVLEAYSVASGQKAVVDFHGANVIVAGAGQWAAWLSGAGYRDSLNRTHPSWYPLAVDDLTGTVALCLDYQRGSGLAVLGTNGVLTAITQQPLDRLEACYHDGELSYRAGGAVRMFPSSLVDATPCQGVRQSQGYAVRYHDVHGTVVYRIGATDGWSLSNDERDFNPDIRVLDSGLVLVATSRTQGEGPRDLRAYVVNPVLGTVNGEPRPLVRLADRPAPTLPAPVPVPEPPTPQPQPTPAPLPVPVPVPIPVPAPVPVPPVPEPEPSPAPVPLPTTGKRKPNVAKALRTVWRALVKVLGW